MTSYAAMAEIWAPYNAPKKYERTRSGRYVLELFEAYPGCWVVDLSDGPQSLVATHIYNDRVAAKRAYLAIRSML